MFSSFFTKKLSEQTYFLTVSAYLFLNKIFINIPYCKGGLRGAKPTLQARFLISKRSFDIKNRELA